MSMPTASSGHGPYPPRFQAAGSPPVPVPDVPASAVFLALFLILGVAHQTLYCLNRKRGVRFVFSGAIFGFCTIRVVACILRIVWVYRPHNVNLAIAAQVFVFAGTLILFIVNLFLCQRLMRARHPHIGWSFLFRYIVPPALITVNVIILLMIIATTVQSFFTLDSYTRYIDRKIMQAGLIVFAITAFVPLAVTIITVLLPSRTYMDKFGSGSFRAKVWLLAFTSSILSLGSAFRAAVTFLPPVLLDEPRPWYLSTGAFYGFNFTIEVVVVIAYLAVRFDKRFHVPNGSSGPGDYSATAVTVLPEEKPVCPTFPTAMERSDSFSEKAAYNTHSMSVFSGRSGATSPSIMEFPTAFGSGSFLSVHPRTGEYILTPLSYSDLDFVTEQSAANSTFYLLPGHSNGTETPEIRRHTRSDSSFSA